MLYLTQKRTMDFIFFNNSKDTIDKITSKVDINLGKFKFYAEECPSGFVNAYLYKFENIDISFLNIELSKLTYQVEHYLGIVNDDEYRKEDYLNEIKFATCNEDNSIMSLILYNPIIEDNIEINLFFI